MREREREGERQRQRDKEKGSDRETLKDRERERGFRQIDNKSATFLISPVIVQNMRCFDSQKALSSNLNPLRRINSGRAK